jgi:hypothetical protein
VRPAQTASGVTRSSSVSSQRRGDTGAADLPGRAELRSDLGLRFAHPVPAEKCATLPAAHRSDQMAGALERPSRASSVIRGVARGTGWHHRARHRGHGRRRGQRALCGDRPTGPPVPALHTSQYCRAADAKMIGSKGFAYKLVLVVGFGPTPVPVLSSFSSVTYWKCPETRSNA